MSPPFFPDDLFKVHKLKPNLKWRQALETYLKTMPPYYLLVTPVALLRPLSKLPCVAHRSPMFPLPLRQPLKKATRMMGAPNLIADTMDCGLSYSVISYLKKLSQQVWAEPHGSRGQKAERHASYLAQHSSKVT